jgi:hypothetical protein
MAKEMFGHSFNLNPKYFDLEQGILQAKVTKVLSRNTYIHIIKYPMVNIKKKMNLKRRTKISQFYFWKSKYFT